MGQKLQGSFFTLFLLVSILLIWDGRTAAEAQISLESALPLEIQFSQGETIVEQSSITVGLSDFQSILSDDLSLLHDQWQPYDGDQNPGINYFVSENSAFVAPGKVQIKDFPYQTFFVSSFQNNSGNSIGHLMLAYDFIYNFFERSENNDFELMYRINDGEWSSVQSGKIESFSLRSDEDSWRSFSINLNIDDIFLRQSDVIHLMWVIDGTETISNEIPMALQRMEIFPEVGEQLSLNRGDVIITEILPKSDVNGSDFEYIEIYNPAEQRLSLKGVEIFTSLGVKVIQQDIYVEPYGFTVISNADISSLEGVNNSYFYSGSIISESRGRVGLERNGQLIASATYEATEPGVALELNRVSRAYDGYSSLQDFAPSQSTYYQDLYGSPGSRGNTVPMYSKGLSDSGLYLFTLPGRSIQRLNRNSALEFYDLAGEPINMDTVEPYQPVLVQKTDNSAVKIFTESEYSSNSTAVPVSELTSGSDFIATPVYAENSGQTMNKSTNLSRIAPVTQIWNRQKQKFDLQFLSQIENDYWSPFVLNESVANLLGNSDNRITGPSMERFIEFSLLPENGNEGLIADAVMLGFLDSPAQNSQLRFDLPKLELLPSANNNTNFRSPLLYLSSTLSSENYNSFTHLPFDINQEYEIGLGAKMIDNAGSATIKWNLNNELPEEWILTLEDTFNGTSVNLREENEYRFRYSSSVSAMNENNQNETPKITAFTAQGRPRFVLKVQPYESFSENTEDVETPDKIELRPNYPNPFNPSTNINFYIPEERSVRVGIYNIVGQQVALLLDDTIQAGEHSLVWDASDKPSGIYIVQLESGNRIFTRKITLIK
ncbi:T9SS type A sorting domain-containing protein [Rhodohalobacter sp. 614A]|uniref:T9SS type A sorting domain-containing protein n=1 Tax=Rhodohalobacter sp. 614A TaxID=2908649 RepID=UPI001F33E8C4|nr:T9SS type A sorting domain-containing protein [Rhodohalobacter sp. 614A]